MRLTLVLVAVGLLTAGAALAQDVCAPNKVSTLATTTYYGSILITWTATGDDGSSGNATSYEVYKSTSNITDTNWQQSPCTLLASGSSATNGNQNCAEVDAACPGTHTFYFAVFLIDDAGNRSPISNVVTGSTRCSAPYEAAFCE